MFKIAIFHSLAILLILGVFVGLSELLVGLGHVGLIVLAVIAIIAIVLVTYKVKEIIRERFF